MIIKDLTASPIAAGSTATVRMRLFDVADPPAPIVGTDLDGLTLTIANTVTGAIINNCHDADILNTGRGTVDRLGYAAIALNAADLVIGDQSVQREPRSLVVTWTLGAIVGKHQVNLMIQRLAGD